jgi:hypothetical protein
VTFLFFSLGAANFTAFLEQMHFSQQVSHSFFRLLNAMWGTKHTVLPCGTDLEVGWTDGRKKDGRNSQAWAAKSSDGSSHFQ